MCWTHAMQEHMQCKYIHNDITYMFAVEFRSTSLPRLKIDVEVFIADKVAWLPLWRLCRRWKKLVWDLLLGRLKLVRRTVVQTQVHQNLFVSPQSWPDMMHVILHVSMYSSWWGSHMIWPPHIMLFYPCCSRVRYLKDRVWLRYCDFNRRSELNACLVTTVQLGMQSPTLFRIDIAFTKSR